MPEMGLRGKRELLVNLSSNVSYLSQVKMGTGGEVNVLYIFSL